MKLRYLLIALLLFITVLCASCSKNDTYDAKLKKVKVGMTENQVINVMGDYEGMDPFHMDYDNDIYYKALYWFDTVNSLTEAEAKRAKGMNVKYYCVVLYSTDMQTYKVNDKADIFSGFWGVE